MQSLIYYAHVPYRILETNKKLAHATKELKAFHSLGFKVRLGDDGDDDDDV